MKGLPQGTPVAPVLANIYLTGFDRAIEEQRWRHVRYADDFVIVAGGRVEAEAQLQFVRTWLRRERNLTIKESKTQYVSLADGFSFVGFWYEAAGRGLGQEKTETFKTGIRTVLSDRSRASLIENVKRHNDVVVGWRNYYGGVTDRLDRQLEELNGWRHAACAEYLAAVGVDASLSELCFATLAPPRPADVDGAYPEWDPLHANPDADPPRADLAAAPDHNQRDKQPGGRPFSSSRGLQAQEIAARQLPVVFDEGSLRIPTFGAFVTMAKAVLVVKLKKQIVFECPINVVDQVVVEADGVAVSSRAITACAKHRIPMVFCRNSGLPAARLVPARSDLRSGLADQQVAARCTTVGATIVIAMITAKIRNQRALLLRTAKYLGRPAEVRDALHETAQKLEESANRCDAIVASAETPWRQQVLLIEARAAAWYWQAFARLLPTELSFSRRHGRGAHDLVNVLLNYGYWLLYQRVWLAVERSGLHPFLGLLHTGRGKAPGLVLDLMEEFRQPTVDQTVLALVGRRAALRIKEGGRLSLRSRRLASGAFMRAIARRDRGVSLNVRVTQQALHLGGAIAGNHPYEAYRARW